MSSELPTKSGLDEASTPAQPERPPPKHIFKGHEYWISSFVFLHDNAHIVSGCSDGTMRKWDCETGLIVGEPWKGEGGCIFALALSQDGETIACGRDDGSVQRWNTDGEMSEGVWMGHSDYVQSLSWSPNGGHIASGSADGTILIRKAENGEVEVGPIETKQVRVYSLAYSPSGERIASGGVNTICIWDSNTSELLVGPIKGLGTWVRSVVWSSDSSKLYSASDSFARVFDSVSGTQLHRFEHNSYLYSVALSPTHNVLACVGDGGIAQLWNTESYQPLGKPFSTEVSLDLNFVSFSRDGRYLAYGGDDNKITLWMVKDIAPELPSLSSFLEVDATNPFARLRGDDTEDEHDNPHGNFFQSSHSSLDSPLSGPSPTRRLWGFFVVSSLLRTPANDSVRFQERLKRRFLTRRARSAPSPLEVPANKERTEPTPDGKVRTGAERNKDVDLPDYPANMTLCAAEQNKRKQPEDLADAGTLPPDDVSPTADLDTNESRTLWRFLRDRGKNATTSPVQMTHDPSPKAVEVYAVRVPQGYVAWKRKRKAKSSVLMTGAPTTAAQASGSSQAGPSSHGRPAHGHTSSLRQERVSSQSIADDLSDSDSIQGSWNRFLDKICFPCGHYEDD